MNPLKMAAILTGLFAGAGLLQGQSLDDALQDGTASGQLRLSYEHADFDDADQKDAADAINLRTRLGYRTGQWLDTTAFLQLQDVSAILPNYAPVDSDYDTVADPEGTSVHQAYLDWEGIRDLRLRVGRQELVLENGRMFSNANWRQHAQSFDAALVSNPNGESWRFTVGNINRIKGVRNTLLTVDHLAVVQADWVSLPGHTLYLHAYLLDAEGGAATDRDKATYGFRFVGDLDMLQYELDYSLQTGYADNEDDGGSMTNAFGALKFGGMRFGLGFAQLTGQDGTTRAYDTLFSTGHGFQGWTDQFAGTNGGNVPEGVVETYLLIGGDEAGIKWQLRVHQFEQETESENYGNEINAVVGSSLTQNLSGLIKVASYTADDGNETGVGASDELVAWVRLDYRF